MISKKLIAVKLCSIILFSFLCMFITHKVKAEEVVVGDYVDQIYIRKDKGNTHQYLRSQWIYRASDGQFVYCLEPWVSIDENQYYRQAASYESSLGFSEEVFNKVRLIAYYGYGYDNHYDDYWYTVTQMLIWKTIDPNGDFYFTDRLNGNRISLFESEINEIMTLVDRHYVIPSFAPKNFNVSIGKNFELFDENNVLNLYEIKRDSQNVVKEKSGNKIVVYSDEAKRASIDIVKKSNIYDSLPFIYISSDSQNVMSVGKFFDLNTNFSVTFISGSIEISKLDKDTKTNSAPNGLTLEKAEYQVFDENNNLVTTLITDIDGKATINNLPLGKYTIKEVKESYGYKLDDTNYTITLTTDNPNQKINVYEALDRKKVEINNSYLDLDNNTTLPESDAIFEFYDHDTKELVGSLTTDNKGQGTIELIYGTYFVKQVSVKEGFQKVKDFILIIDKDTKDIKKDLVNYPEPIDQVVIYPITKIIQIPNTAYNEKKISLILLPILLISNNILRKKIKYENN